MYDSVNPARIPRDAEMVAGYDNGPYAWSAADWALFPNAVHVGIAVRATYNGGQVLDVEAGDATPAQAPDWVSMRRAAGVDPSIYCSQSTWPTVAREFNRQGVLAPHYWIAHYDSDPRIPIGAVAKQYANGPDWDASSVIGFWPGVDTLITPPTEVYEMQGYKTSTMRNLVVPCNGLRQLFVEVPGAATGEHADGHAYFVADTPPGTAAAYTGDRELHFSADRPGPVDVPLNTRAVSFYYTASADFTAWCA